MLIIDASCLYDLLVGTHRSDGIRARLQMDDNHAAPHVIDVEVFSVIRRDFLRGDIDRTAATQAVEDLRDWRGTRYGHTALLERAWELRASVRGWDAFYVALAESFQAPLLTLDGRLGRAPGVRCSIEVIPELS